jgi:hypothetical protein
LTVRGLDFQIGQSKENAGQYLSCVSLFVEIVIAESEIWISMVDGAGCPDVWENVSDAF